MKIASAKACPFCGSDRLKFCKGSYDSGGGWGQDTIRVGCLNCGALGGVFDDRTEESKTKAVEAWNLRAI